jgi:hypothetical protein
VDRRKYISKKLALGIAGLLVLLGEAVLDAVLGLPHGDMFIKATITLGLGGTVTQGTIDLLNTGTAKLVTNEVAKRLFGKPAAPPAA